MVWYMIYFLPPRFLRGLSLGTGNARFFFGGGGSCHLRTLRSTSSRISLPLLPVASSKKLSIRAANTHLLANYYIRDH
jgi:hypothetical protein